MSDREQYYVWALGPDIGISSKTIVQVLTGAHVLGLLHPSPPLDPSDFGRCERMLDLFPWLRLNLFHVADVYPEWRPMIGAWDELRALYAEELAENTGSAPRLYARMRALRDVPLTPEERTTVGNTTDEERVAP